jgi:hypothetical protein
MTSAGGQQLPVQDAEMAGGEPLELDRPKSRDHGCIEKPLIGRRAMIPRQLRSVAHSR